MKAKYWYLIVTLAAFVCLAFFLRADIQWSVRYLMHTQPVVERSVMQPLPECPGCNVILISLDTVRADRMGFLGSRKGLTPNLDKIAALSTVFTNAFTNACFTTPSHMTLFTSLYPQVHGTESTSFRRTDAEQVYEDHPLDAKYVTMAEVLRKNGYHTHWHGPIEFRYFSARDGFLRGFDTARPSPFPRGLPLVNAKFEKLKVDEIERSLSVKGKPAFVFLHSYIAHSPYYISEEAPDQQTEIYTDAMLSDFKMRIERAPGVLLYQGDSPPKTQDEQEGIVSACLRFDDLRDCFRKLSVDAFWHAVGQWQTYKLSVRMRGEEGKQLEQDVKNLNRAYDRGIAELDSHFGELWSFLEAKKFLDNSIVIFFSDHGEQLFEQGTVGHATFYEHTARVPLMIYHPKTKSGLRIPQKTSLIDVLPMLLETLKLDSPAQVQGKSPWKGEPENIYSFSMGLQMVRGDHWKLIKNPGGREELYYLPLDPLEQNDLIHLRNPWVRNKYEQLNELRRNTFTEMAL